MSRMSPLLDKMRWKFLDEGRNVNLEEQRGERLSFYPAQWNRFDKVCDLFIGNF